MLWVGAQGVVARLLSGHSAGGQIAALMSLHKDWLANAGLPADVIKGCFCLATTFNRRTVRPDVAPDHVQPGSTMDTAPDSPLALANGATVPFFIAWGRRDDERMERTGHQMIDALTATACEVQSLVLPDCDHFSSHLNTRHAGDPWVQRVRSLMVDVR